jgi:hypothetical protein
MSTSAVNQLRPLARDVSFSNGMLCVELADGRVISAPLAWFPKLENASDEQRADWRLVGQGVGVHWEALDEDVSVAGLLG